MSMATLLSHFRLDTARYVTSNGQIVFDGVKQTGTGFVHSTHGTVTPVAAHTFHGGDDPIEGWDGPWWADDAQAQRHVNAMEAAFPGFEYRCGKDGPPSWAGVVNTGRGSFTVGVFLRHDRGLPHVQILSGQRLGRNVGRTFVKSPHLYVSGRLCVADQDDWNPDVHTAATATAWAAHWLAAFTEWRFTLRWPVDGVTSAA